MPLLKIIPDDTNIGFVKLRYWAFGLTALLTVISAGLVAWHGLNLGVDFVGGVMIEARFQQEPDLEEVRSTVDQLGVGTASLQASGDPRIVTIRLPLPEGDEAAAQQVVQRAQQGLRTAHPDIQFNRADTVSGKVSDELIWNGLLAVFLAILGIALFTWIRYEWQFGVSTFVAVLHDVLMALGFFAITQMEFDLSIVAAILTIIGYSINDKVVVDDRIRENMRKYRKMEMGPLIDLSVNEVLPRTVMTSVTVLVALIALLIFGGHVLRGFTAAMILGIIVGTYSSIYVSASMLISLGLRADAPSRKGSSTMAGAERVGPRNERMGNERLSSDDGAQV